MGTGQYRWRKSMRIRLHLQRCKGSIAIVVWDKVLQEHLALTVG